MSVGECAYACVWSSQKHVSIEGKREHNKERNSTV